MCRLYGEIFSTEVTGAQWEEGKHKITDTLKKSLRDAESHTCVSREEKNSQGVAILCYAVALKPAVISMIENHFYHSFVITQ